MENNVAKLKAKAAFYLTYSKELENQEPFNTKDIINTAKNSHVVYDNEHVFNREQSQAIKRAIKIVASNDNGNYGESYLLDVDDCLDSESVNIHPILSKIDYLTEDK